MLWDLRIMFKFDLSNQILDINYFEKLYKNLKIMHFFFHKNNTRYLACLFK